ncbi:hypothetical protein GMI70_09465 [Eggerthellaceae bacterium zg-893]|nr:hypothetical protein [Eggerthellaceae bacterium zg-893]
MPISTLINDNVLIYSHIAMIDKRIEGVATIVSAVIPVLCAASISAAAQDHRAVIGDSRCAMAHVVHDAGAGDGKRGIICYCNSIIIATVSDFLTVEVNGYHTIGRNGNTFFILRILKRNGCTR